VFSIDWSDPQTLWLNLTNLALGVVVLAGVLVLVGGILQELRLRAKRRAAGAAPIRAIDDHAFDVPGLGLTMADGGERIEKKQ
jgi:hypothetical protein